MKGNAVGWFEIYVQDSERSKKFYESVFDKKLDNLSVEGVEMWAFSSDMSTYGSGGSLVRVQGVPSGGNSTIVYFECDDCAIEEKRAGEAGGKIARSKMSIGQYGFVSLVHDTEGNMIGLHSMK
jgi:uncharacterized protein